ncbi:hypothetical protein ASPSYDRAFT_378527 [Aspergillus sydowii CBS 593.65]|uniref:Secreted protein n=1 Tax=Aspergillus sydowii CBS 593.65 TaxID=1036612 RepID=A0A1L9U0R6_9EURO|nr:uncharacterized protein ASPSYDRAFT_378527 [Aspergillus sydowii CBS 593.65]OJJ65252.1 hypothetical protein ASPSYDRAFT_378527 [Aspergillus sydowii CBS 593.65]
MHSTTLTFFSLALAAFRSAQAATVCLIKFEISQARAFSEPNAKRFFLSFYNTTSRLFQINLCIFSVLISQRVALQERCRPPVVPKSTVQLTSRVETETILFV